MLTLADLHLLAGNEEDYRELRAKIVADANTFDDDPNAANVLSRACSLRPGAGTELAISPQLAERALASEPKNPWFLYGVGAAHHRAGNHAEAIARLEESLRAHPSWGGRGQNYVMLAMACQQLGQHKEARQWLVKARGSLDEIEQTYGKGKYGFGDSNYLNDWLAIQVLLPEADALIQKAVAP